MPQAMFCTLQTRYPPPQTELDLKAVTRGLKQDGAAVSVSPSPVPTQTALPLVSSRAALPGSGGQF